jgi:hypothetical protein
LKGISCSSGLKLKLKNKIKIKKLRGRADGL